MRASRLLLVLVLSLCFVLRLTAQINTINAPNEAQGEARPGETIVISGSGFGMSPGSLKIGDASVAVAQSNWQTGSISAVVPSLPAGSAAVVVSVPPLKATPAQTYIGKLTVLGSIRVDISPKIIQPSNGKLPSSMPLGLVEADCDDNQGTDLTQSYSLVIPGTGLVLSSTTATKCNIIATLNIDQNAAGPYKAFLLDKDKRPVASADIGVLDSAAGLIPPGLTPDVDVMWEVMGYKNCSDAFGRRVADSMYCIQVKIGNNTGHPLQLAGLGFARELKRLAELGLPSEVTIANNSYASTRAILVHAQSISARNVGYAFLQGVGLIMASSSPFIGNSGTAHHFLTFNTIVNGPLVVAYNLILPDPIVKQLNNLDDQSFRDNLVIANNAQIQTIVFVEKQALTQSLEEIRSQIVSSGVASDKGNNSGKKGGKVDATTDDSQAKDFQRRLQSDIDKAIKNSTRPLRFIPWGPSSNPLLVKLALGKLVIVGDEIEYLQRLQIQSGGTPSLPPALAVNPLSLSFSNQNGVTDGGPQPLTVTNTSSTALSSVTVQILGPNASDFSAQTNPCASGLAAGATCTLSVAYTPAASSSTGTRTATLQVSFSSGITPLSIPLAGAALGTIFVSGTQFSLPAAKVGTTTSTSLTITNFNSAAAMVSNLSSAGFSLTGCPTVLAANTSCTNAAIQFAPTSIGPQATTLTPLFQVQGSAPATIAIAVKGTGQ